MSDSWSAGVSEIALALKQEVKGAPKPLRNALFALMMYRAERSVAEVLIADLGGAGADRVLGELSAVADSVLSGSPVFRDARAEARHFELWKLTEGSLVCSSFLTLIAMGRDSSGGVRVSDIVGAASASGSLAARLFARRRSEHSAVARCEVVAGMHRAIMDLSSWQLWLDVQWLKFLDAAGSAHTGSSELRARARGTPYLSAVPVN